jgi:hypothetical protein
MVLRKKEYGTNGPLLGNAHTLWTCITEKLEDSVLQMLIIVAFLQLLLEVYIQGLADV